MKTRKKWVMALSCLLCCTATNAYDFEVDGIFYRKTSVGDNPTVKVDYRSFIGNTYNDFYIGDIVIPETVSYEDVTYTVTAIGGNAFEGCNQVTSIQIPSTVTTIEQTAFYNCSRLAQINIPEGVTAINNYTFENCRSLTSIDLPSTITYIGTYAFMGCSALESIELPEGVTSINAEAFSGCSNLKSINIPDGVTAINEETFYECTNLQTVTISNNITTIGSDAFYGCAALTDITIPESVTSIGQYAFYGCSGLTSVSIGNSLTSVGMSAFKDCTSLTSVHITDLDAWCGIQFNNYCSNPLSSAHHLYLNGEEITDLVIPEFVTSIGAYAFYGCSGITSITIPESVTSIGTEAFYGCSSLTDINISNSVTSIGTEAFYDTGWWNNQSDGLIYLDNHLLGYKGDKPTGEITIKDGTKSIENFAFSGCSDLTSITIPNSVTSIGVRAFDGCTGLMSITIPESVTSIGSSTFSGCSSLTSIIIPESVKSIGSGTFSGCSGLTSITIPESVTSIESSTFSGCSSLTSITIPESVKSIGTYAFNGCVAFTNITIPESVTSIGEYAFRGCAGLANITIPNSITSIESNTFNGCTGLTCVTIPESVASIGMEAFYGCSNLKTVVNFSDLIFSEASSDYGYIAYYADRIIIADKQVGDFYFKTDNGIHYLNGYVGTNEKITLPETYNGESYKIGDEAFYNCSWVKTVINFSSLSISRGSSSNGYVGYYADRVINADEQVDDFYFRTDGNGTHYLSGYTGTDEEIMLPENYNNENYAIEERAFYGCSSLTNVIIPESVTSIGDNTFSNCSNLTDITIPNSVTSIGQHAFRLCSSLTSITIPNSVTIIGNYTFYKCSNLASITIPNSVTIIANYAFYGCSSLQNLTIQTASPFSVATMTDFCTSATLTVPNGCAKAYSDLGGFWGQFATIKEEASIKIPEANKWSTCALAFDAALPEGVRAFVSTGMEENYVLLEEVTSLTANTPYVLYAQNGYEGTLSGTVDVANYQTSVTDGALNGAITQQTISEGYVLQNQGEGSKFYNVNGQTFTIPAGKCWLSAVSASGARSVMMRFPGGATDIEGLYVERPAETDGKIYTLDGKEVETMQSGHIYIKDGKKVLKR